MIILSKNTPDFKEKNYLDYQITLMVLMSSFTCGQVMSYGNMMAIKFHDGHYKTSNWSKQTEAHKA